MPQSAESAVAGGPNPFVYAHPVGPEDLIDRATELGELRELVDGGHYARLSAPRRYGKTTLLSRVRTDAERLLGRTAIDVDFSRVLSLGDVAIRVEDAYRRATDGPVKGLVRQIMRSWNLGVALGAGGLGARLEANPKIDPLPALHRLLDLPRDVFSRGGDRFVVTFDEFHEVLKLDGVDGILRSHIQHQGEFASYVFAGSEPGMMETLFARRERPLFGQAHPVELGPLNDADLGAFIAERFRTSGRDAGEALDALLEFADGHPQRAMMLAHYLWRETPHGATASVSTWSEALDAAVAPRAEGFDRFLDTLSTTEERVLFALALSPTGPYSTYAQQRFGLPRSSAADALRSLAGRGEVVTVDGVPRITDPLLRWWLRQRRTA